MPVALAEWFHYLPTFHLPQKGLRQQHLVGPLTFFQGPQLGGHLMLDLSLQESSRDPKALGEDQIGILAFNLTVRRLNKGRTHSFSFVQSSTKAPAQG